MATFLGLPPLHAPLILELFMTLPLLELCWWVVEICYSCWLSKMGRGYAWKETKCGLTYLQIAQWVPLMPLGDDDELGHYLVER